MQRRFDRQKYQKKGSLGICRQIRVAGGLAEFPARPEERFTGGRGGGVTDPDQRTRRMVYWGTGGRGDGRGGRGLPAPTREPEERFTGGMVNWGCLLAQPEYQNNGVLRGRGGVTGPIRVSEERLTGGCWKNGLLGVAGLTRVPEERLTGGGGVAGPTRVPEERLTGGGGGCWPNQKNDLLWGCGEGGCWPDQSTR